MKHRVETLSNGHSRFQVKLWAVGEEEPENADLERWEENDDVQAGSVLLLAHFSDVTFGDIRVIPIDAR
ncbi:MAG: hypothetical protein O3C20_14955 [Verrucomicrobia bacterium]|nr:hypothetical protein [Verrucomicrobiota bacterium]